MNKPRTQACNKPQVHTPAVPPPSPVAPTSRKLDMVQIGSVGLSILALIVAIWAANETREARLDTRRIQLRGEALVFIQETRSAVNAFNCYALVKGADLKGKDEFMRFLADQERLIRDGLSNIANFSPGALTAYERSLNNVKGQVQNTFNEKLILIRNSWDKELREKADSVCNP